MPYTKEDLERMRRNLGITNDELVTESDDIKTLNKTSMLTGFLQKIKDFNEKRRFKKDIEKLLLCKELNWRQEHGRTDYPKSLGSFATSHDLYARVGDGLVHIRVLYEYIASGYHHEDSREFHRYGFCLGTNDLDIPYPERDLKLYSEKRTWYIEDVFNPRGKPSNWIGKLYYSILETLT
jgi:hypothetical protein